MKEVKLDECQLEELLSNPKKFLTENQDLYRESVPKEFLTEVKDLNREHDPKIPKKASENEDVNPEYFDPSLKSSSTFKTRFSRLKSSFKEMGLNRYSLEGRTSCGRSLDSTSTSDDDPTLTKRRNFIKKVVSIKEDPRKPPTPEKKIEDNVPEELFGCSLNLERSQDGDDGLKRKKSLVLLTKIDLLLEKVNKDPSISDEGKALFKKLTSSLSKSMLTGFPSTFIVDISNEDVDEGNPARYEDVED